MTLLSSVAIYAAATLLATPITVGRSERVQFTSVLAKTASGDAIIGSIHVQSAPARMAGGRSTHSLGRAL
jgi:hypothetical protein